MCFDTLPTEIVTQIFLSLPDISSAIALSATCYRFNTVYHSSKRLLILTQAAEAEFGPLDDAIQLVTHNASQPAHAKRSVPISDALIQQVVTVGRVAQRWEEIYPFKKWKSDYASRRLLTTAERYLVRRAIYRLWLFTTAFHNSGHVRTCRRIPEVMRERAALLHNFSTPELAEMLDVQAVMRDVVANKICPSNGKMRQKFQKRFPDGNPHRLMVNIHVNYPPTSNTLWGAPSDSTHHNSSSILASHQPNHISPFWSRFHDPGADGWGDDITHYYVVEDMLKLSPQQLLYLRDFCPVKVQVESFVKEVGGEWFGNNGETFRETLDFVIGQRGEDAEEMRERIEDKASGIVDECGARWVR